VKKSITTPFGEYRVVTEVPLAERGKKEDVSFPACAAFWVRRWTVRLRSSAPLEFLHFGAASRSSFVPLDKGIEALRKLPRAFFAAGVLEFTVKDPLWSPFSRGATMKSQTKGLASVRLRSSAPYGLRSRSRTQRFRFFFDPLGFNLAQVGCAASQAHDRAVQGFRGDREYPRPRQSPISRWVEAERLLTRGLLT